MYIYMEGRKKKATRNMLCGFMGQGINIVLSFLNRTIFLYCFTKEYVGISSLFTGIFSFLSLADLGMEASMTVKLYKPLAENNQNEIRAILTYYKKIFNVIALVIAGCGTCLLPFLKYLVDIPNNVENVGLIYILSLMNTVATYFFIYRKILFVADQKKYITDIIQYLITFLEYIVLIPVLLFTKSYILYLILQIVFKLSYNTIVMMYATKKYSYLGSNEKCELSINVKESIKKDMKAISLHRFGDVVNAQSWTLIASSFINIVTVGMYANYQMIINYVKVMMDKVFYSLSPSIGNLIVTEKKEDVISFFKKMLFVSFVLTSVCGTCLLCLLNPFIDLWIGDKYLLGFNIVVISIVNFYIVNMRKTVLIFKEAYGFFTQDRFRPIIESVLSIFTSILLVVVFDMGLSGVLLGTVVAYMSTTFWIEPLILFRDGFRESSKVYFNLYFKYLITTITLMSGTYLICQIMQKGFLAFLGKAMLSVLIPVIIIIVFFHHTEEYKWLFGLAKNIVKRKR